MAVILAICQQAAPMSEQRSGELLCRVPAGMNGPVDRPAYWGGELAREQRRSRYPRE